MSGGGSRVTIPADDRKTIQNITEITAGKHSAEDIYSVLMECSMDPNETIQKLLYLDSFHEVKRKTERKKEGGTTQMQGGRGWRGNNISQDVARGRNVAPRKENRVNRSSERGSLPVSDKNNNEGTTNVTKSLNVAVNDALSLSNGTSIQGSDSQASAGVDTLHADAAFVDIDKLRNAAPQLSTDYRQQSDSKHVPTFASRVKAGKRMPISHSNHNSVSAVGSVSGPVLVPSLNSHSSDAASGNGPNVVSQQVGSLSSTTATTESIIQTQIKKHVPEKVDDSGSISTTLGTAMSLDTTMPEQSEEADQRQLLTSNSDSHLSQQNSPSKVLTSESRITTIEASSQAPPEFMLEEESTKPPLSDVQHVIFPNHFQVPEEFKVGLTFGSFDVISGLTNKVTNNASGENTSTEAVDFFQTMDETAREPSLSNQSVASTAQEIDYPDHVQSPKDMPENLTTPSEGDDTASEAQKFDQFRQETLLPIGGPPFLVAQNFHSYSYGFVPPMVVSPPIQLEKSDSQAHIPNFANGSSLVQSTAPPSTQQGAVAQSAISASPHQVPIYRQTYPHNYFPYGQYLSPFVMTPMHHFLGQGGFPQQPSTGYLPQATMGLKYPLPPYKPMTNLANQTHVGIPSSHGSFTSAPVGYSLSAAVTSGGSSGNEDFSASHLNEKNMYPAGQQTEGPSVWIAATGRDAPGMLANSYYNLHPHGQHVAFSPAQSGHGAFPGLYHPAQTMTAPSTYHPLQQQSQTIAGSAETVGHPPAPAAYQQQQQGVQMNWNGTTY